MAETAAATTVAAPDKTDATAAAATTTATTTADKGTAATTATTAAASTTTAAAATTLTADPDKATTAPATWPEDWVTRVAKGDEKRAKDFAKFQSPEALADAYTALRTRMDSGQVKTALAKDAKPEEIAAWRKDNGIPDAPEKYDLGGLKVPESDKGLVGEFLKAAHGSNMTPEQAKVSVESYYAQQSAVASARAAKDVEQQQSALDALNKEWGGNYRRNINILTGTVLSKIPESARALFQDARLPDGTLLLNNVDAVRGLVAIGMELNPAGVVVPAVGGDLGKSAMDEYKGIQKTMRENRTTYNKDAGMQARFVELAGYLSKNELIDGQGNEIVQRKRAA